jgi:hypothetical protein
LFLEKSVVSLIYQVSDKRPLKRYGDVESYLSGAGSVSFGPRVRISGEPESGLEGLKVQSCPVKIDENRKRSFCDLSLRAIREKNSEFRFGIFLKTVNYSFGSKVAAA